MDINSKDWSSFYRRKGMLNAICGFGKEAVSTKSVSFISYAKANGWID